MFGFDSKDFLFVFPRFCLFLVGFQQPTLSFFAYILSTNISKNKKTQVFFGCVIFPFFVMVWYGFKSQKKMCFLFFAYMLSTNISKKTKKTQGVFLLLLWFDMVSKAKSKKNLSFCFLHTCYQRYLKKTKKKLMCFLFFAFVVMVWYVMQYLIQRVPDTLHKSWGQWGML